MPARTTKVEVGWTPGQLFWVGFISNAVAVILWRYLNVPGAGLLYLVVSPICVVLWILALVRMFAGQPTKLVECEGLPSFRLEGSALSPVRDADGRLSRFVAEFTNVPRCAGTSAIKLHQPVILALPTIIDGENAIQVLRNSDGKSIGWLKGDQVSDILRSMQPADDITSKWTGAVASVTEDESPDSRVVQVVFRRLVESAVTDPTN